MKSGERQRFSRPETAEPARAARGVEPRDSHAPARERLGAGPAGRHPADDLVARHDRRLAEREVALHDVEVGPADAAGRDLDEHLARARDGLGHLLEGERPRRDRCGSVEPLGAHARTLAPEPRSRHAE